MMEGPRGARVAVSTLQGISKTFAVAPRMIEVAPGVWNLVGIGISSRHKAVRKAIRQTL